MIDYNLLFTLLSCVCVCVGVGMGVDVYSAGV